MSDYRMCEASDSINRTMVISRKLSVFWAIIFLLLPSINMAAEVCLPRTGQETCYDKKGAVIPCTGTGQDADIKAGIRWPKSRFKDNKDGTITDRFTGLMWTKNADLSNGAVTWNEAFQHIETINKDAGTYGYKDWRLPNLNEIKSLINSGQKNNASWLEYEGFQNVRRLFYWSSTTYAKDTNLAWIVYMEGGIIGGQNKYGSCYILSVRDAKGKASVRLPKTGQKISFTKGDDGDLQKGAAWPLHRFTVKGDCVKDKLTGLIWAGNANLINSPLTWQEALDYVKKMNLCGFEDWRLPNINELRSIINFGESKNAEWLNSEGFQNVQNFSYWSSSTYATDPGVAFVVPISHYGMRSGNKSTRDYVWPVRDKL